MLAAAHGFQRVRGEQWRLREVADGPARILTDLALEPTAEPMELDARHDIPIGWLAQADDRVALGAAVPLGALPARTAEFVAAVDHPILITPWRSLVLADMDEWTAEQVVRVLAPMGLIFDANSPWLAVTACAGRPGCAKSLTDVRADAADAVASGGCCRSAPRRRICPRSRPIRWSSPGGSTGRVATGNVGVRPGR